MLPELPLPRTSIAVHAIATRLATSADHAAIYQLYQSAMKAHVERIWGWDESWQRNDFDCAFDTSTSYVVETGMQFCGYFQLQFAAQADYLRKLILTAPMRSRGLGRRLLANIVATSHRSDKQLTLRVFRVNTDALRFYLSNGWRIAAEEEAFYLLEPTQPVVRQTQWRERTAASYTFTLNEI